MSGKEEYKYKRIYFEARPNIKLLPRFRKYTSDPPEYLYGCYSKTQDFPARDEKVTLSRMTEANIDKDSVTYRVHDIEPVSGLQKTIILILTLDL